MSRLRGFLVSFTLISVAVYFPLETYITWDVARTLLVLGYVMDVIGMALMLWGALATRAGLPYGPGVLASGWAWTTAVLWQAARGRYWMASQGMPLYGGPAELILAPALTVVTLAVFAGSLTLVVRDRESR